MNRNTDISRVRHIDQSTLRILYQNNKAFIISFLVIVIALVLLVQVSIPQYQELLQMREEEKATRGRIEILKANIGLLNSLNTSKLESDLDILSKALTPEKDFAGIMGAIASGARTAEIELSDFSFVVGELSSKPSLKTTETTEKGNPNIKIELIVKGELDKIKNFVTKMSERFPLSEVAVLTISGNQATAKTSFYYKFYPTLKFDDTARIKPLPVDSEDIINKMLTFQKAVENATPSSSTQLTTSIGTSSSTPVFKPAQ